jgi:ferric-dicitrate binding protein FerR (iron transport regulator)
MLAAIAPRYNMLRASEAARVRVLRSRDKLAEDETAYTPAGLRSLLSLHPRAVLAGSLALAAAVVTAAVLLFRPPVEEVRPHLAAVRVDNGVTMDDRPLIDRARVFEGSAITLPEKTAARLEYGRGFSITLVGPALFTVDRLKSRRDSEPVDLEGSLRQGILVSASGGGRTVAYAYNTPGARIEPTGTEFLLQSAGGATLVVMKTGSVSVRPAASAESVHVAAGNRCMVKEKADVSRAAPEDLKIFSSMEQLRGGAFERQLLKPEPLGKEKNLKQKMRALRPESREKSGGNAMRRSRPDVPDDVSKAARRDTITGPVKPGTREQERINKNKKLLREARQAIRQKRRAKK